MKLHFISAHEKVGPLRKQIGVAGVASSYPNAAKLTSYEEEIPVSIQGLRDYVALLKTHAAKGHALYKGLFERPLKNESRKKKTLTDEPTQLLVIDVDDLAIPDFNNGKKTFIDVMQVAEDVIQLLPEELHSVSYVAVASSSFGLKSEKVSVHIHMLLERPIMPATLKSWLTSLNYTQPDIFERLELTPSKMHLKSIIDPCLAEASRLIYIAPPFFGENATNPFRKDEERFAIVEKEHVALNLNPLLSNLSDTLLKVEESKTTVLRKLQRKLGINHKKRLKEKFVIDGESHFVITNPESLVMEVASYDEQYVRYNIGGGDSNAYWVKRNNPEIMYCFKPDEEPFLFRKAAPNTYHTHIERFGEGFTLKTTEDGVTRKISHLMFMEQYNDNYVTVEYDEAADEVIDYRLRKTVVFAQEWMKSLGQIVPDPVPSIFQVMDPNDERAIYKEDGRTYINTYQPTPYMGLDAEGFELSYGEAWQIHLNCPNIAEIIFHILGADFECFEHFINWLAFIFQYKDKTKTAWLLHGTQGTGKGLFFNLILKPIFGEDYTETNTLDGIMEDPFNGWLEKSHIVMVDEFSINATNASQKKTIASLKSMVTEPSIMIRNMHRQQKSSKSRANLIFCTNEFDALSLDDKRRFNVPPRQEIMLEKRLPLTIERDEDFDEIIKAELSDFARYLKAFKVDRRNVLKILETDDRAEVLKAGMSASQRFFDDIKQGNFAAFADFLDKPELALSQEMFLKLKRVKHVLRSILPHVNTAEYCYLMKDDLRELYSYLAGKPINQNAFSRMMNAAGIKIRRISLPVGYQTPMPSRPRCVEIDWRYEDQAELEEIKAIHLINEEIEPDAEPSF